MSSEPPPAYSPPAGATGGYTQVPAGATGGYTQVPAGTTGGYTQVPAGATGGYTQVPAGATGGYTQVPAGATGGYTQVPAGAAGGYAQVPSGAVGPGYPDPKVQTNQPNPGSYQGGAPAGVYPCPPGYQPVSGQHPGYPAPNPQTVIVQPQAQVIAVVGGCPACRVGVLEDDFTCLGVCCAILFFPLGLICCLLMRQRRCPNCGAVFG